MEDWRESLFFKLETIKKHNNNNLNMANLDAIIKEFLKILSIHLTNDQEKEIYNEVELILVELAHLKKEVSTISSKILNENFIPEVTSTLNSNILQAEKSTNNIIDISNEIIQLCKNIEDVALREKIMFCCIKNIENCNFQDLNGQRIKKINHYLYEVESVFYKLIHLVRPEHKKENLNDEKKLLNGPRDVVDSPCQKDIDDLFNS